MNLQFDVQGGLQAVDLLRQRAAAYLIIVFGSYAKGLARSDSDIDIAYAGEKTLSAYEIFLLAQELAVLLGRDVDLLDLSQVSTVMKAQIVAFGRVIYCSDEVKRQYLFMKALREYATLSGERAVIVDSIARRGSVYAD
jgi:predicted nucleotidyltransferase